MEGRPRAVGGAHDPGLGDRKYVFFFKMYRALCCSQEGWKVQDVRGREARGEERSMGVAAALLGFNKEQR